MNFKLLVISSLKDNPEHPWSDPDQEFILLSVLTFNGRLARRHPAAGGWWYFYHATVLNVDISVTPPLPALSPSQSANQTPQSSPDFRLKYKLSQPGNNKPDLLENETVKKLQVSGGRGWVRVRWGDDVITLILSGERSHLRFYYYHSISSSVEMFLHGNFINTAWPELGVTVVMRWTT